MCVCVSACLCALSDLQSPWDVQKEDNFEGFGEPGELWAKLLPQDRHQKNFGTKLLSQGRHLGGLIGNWKLSTDDTGQ